MKGIVTLLVLLSTVLSVSAQSSFKAGINTVFFGTGDLRGAELYNEYNHSLSPFVTLAPSLHAGYGASRSGNAKGSIATDVTFFFSPMRFQQSKVRLGVGPSLRFLTDQRLSAFPVEQPSPR